MSYKFDHFPTIEDYVGNTPLVRLQRLVQNPSSVVLAKLEGNNPAGSVKDRPALNMIRAAEARGEIQPGDCLIEATSGNTGIALAMVAAVRGYKMILIMPTNSSEERKITMRAYGAELIEVSNEEGMEGARDLALAMEAEGRGKILNQFANPDNPAQHYQSTAMEIWQQTEGRITHFVSSMGTTGTIVGSSRYFKEQNPNIQIIGLQPASDAEKNPRHFAAGPPEYLPSIYDDSNIDEISYISQSQAENTARLLAQKEGLFIGVSGSAAISHAIAIANEHDDTGGRSHRLRSRRPLSIHWRLVAACFALCRKKPK